MAESLPEGMDFIGDVNFNGNEEDTQVVKEDKDVAVETICKHFEEESPKEGEDTRDDDAAVKEDSDVIGIPQQPETAMPDAMNNEEDEGRDADASGDATTEDNDPDKVKAENAQLKMENAELTERIKQMELVARSYQMMAEESSGTDKAVGIGEDAPKEEDKADTSENNLVASITNITEMAIKSVSSLFDDEGYLKCLLPNKNGQKAWSEQLDFTAEMDKVVAGIVTMNNQAVANVKNIEIFDEEGYVLYLLPDGGKANKKNMKETEETETESTTNTLSSVVESVKASIPTEMPEMPEVFDDEGYIKVLL